MKRSNNSNRYLIPQYSSVCDRSSLVCDHRPALKEIAREQSLVTQLRAIVLPSLQADERCELVAHIFESILDCSRKVMSELQQLQSDTRADDLSVDDKRRVRKISVDCSMEEIGKPHRQHKRRYVFDLINSVKLIINAPVFQSYLLAFQTFQYSSGFNDFLHHRL